MADLRFKFTLFLVWVLALPGCRAAVAEGVDAMVARAQVQFSTEDDSGALRILREARVLAPDHLEARWREAYILLVVANRQHENSRRREVFQAVYPKTDTLLRRFPRSADAWFVGALALGVQATLVSSRQRLELSKEIRKRIGRCLELAPDHPGGWYLLGRWHQGFASLNGFERTMVKVLFGAMPVGTSLDSARISLEHAAVGRPQDLQINLDLARVLVGLNQPENARVLARRALGFPLVSAGDRENRRAIQELLRQL